MVELIDIDKSFGGINALKKVSFSADSGSIHAIVGENGAGKSTLMKILSGAYRKDSGEIRINNESIQFHHPDDAMRHGIGIIYQEFSLIPDLSVAENIFLHRLSKGSGRMRWNELNREASHLIQKLGFSIDPAEKIRNLSIAKQQIVEIAKALSENVSILILDEPTAVLAPRETEHLFETLKSLREQGVTILYITHRLEELFLIADRITVLRDGEVTASMEASQADQDTIIKHMIGRKIDSFFPPRDTRTGKEIFRVEKLSIRNVLSDISFSLGAGEVLGISGLVGSGRTELVRAIFAADKRDSGDIFLEGNKIRIKSPIDAVKNGIGLVPEDRKNQGVILPLSVRKNISLANFKSVQGAFGMLNEKKEEISVNALIQQLGIKTGSLDSKVGELSGGNQQKVVLAKWLGRSCRLLIMDEPTRGVDVGAKQEIYKLINRLAGEGLGIIIVSSEILEVMGICDRVMVMRDGAISGELNKEDFSEEKILRLAIGEGPENN